MMHYAATSYLSVVSLLRVLVVGGQGVGKSSLCSQFVSAENINTYELAQDTGQGQGGVQRWVRVNIYH